MRGCVVISLTQPGRHVSDYEIKNRRTESSMLYVYRYVHNLKAITRNEISRHNDFDDSKYFAWICYFLLYYH